MFQLSIAPTRKLWSSNLLADTRQPGFTWSISKRNDAKCCTSFVSNPGNRSIRYSAKRPAPWPLFPRIWPMRKSCSLSICSAERPKVPRGNNGSFVASSNIYFKIRWKDRLLSIDIAYHTTQSPNIDFSVPRVPMDQFRRTQGCWYHRQLVALLIPHS